jgi:hypothetical protein
METKIVEIRDSGTFVGAMVLRMTSDNPVQRYYLRRVGCNHDTIVLMALNDQVATSDVYEWPRLRPGTRTMQVAHDWVQSHFDEIKDGDVIDVEFILGIKPEKKVSERLTRP